MWAKAEMNEKPYRSRGYLPHLEIPNSTYFVTLRLSDTLPQNVLDVFRSELKIFHEHKQNQKLCTGEEQRLKYLQTKKIQDYLDAGVGECWLKQPLIAAIVEEAIRHHDGEKYNCHVCCIMPNHLHWILTPKKTKEMTKLDSQIISIMQSFKSFTAHSANKILNRTGPFWSREYYDHRIRTVEEFGKFVEYTIQNPVKAKLCSHWKEWPWTICSKSILDALNTAMNLHLLPTQHINV
jgi:REP element-mobilizing transposase RayT